MAQKPKVFIWQWGRFGAGPRIAFELAEALRQYSDFQVLLSLARDAEILTKSCCLGAVEIPVNTYEGLVQFAVRTALIKNILAPMFERLERERPDIAVSVMPGYWDAYVIGKLERMGIPVATIVHDASNHPGDHFQLIHWVQNRMSAQSSAILTLSEFVNDCLSEQGKLGDKPHCVIAHPSLDFPDLKLKNAVPAVFVKDRPLRFLMIGRLRKYKGIELLLSALSGVDPKLFDLRIAGSFNDKVLQNEIENYPDIETHIGWLPEEEVVSHVDWADVVVLPYTEASQSGIVPLAFSRGKMVIVTPVGGLPEQVSHQQTGLVAAQVSSLALRKEIETCIDNPDLVKTCSDNALSFSRADISWQQIGQQYGLALSGFLKK